MNFNIKHANFDQFIGKDSCYYIYWELNGKKFCSQVIFIKENRKEKVVVLSHRMIVDGEKQRISASIKELIENKIEGLLKDAAINLKLEADYFESMAYEEVKDLPEKTQIDKWVEYYEYKSKIQAEKRMSECKQIYNGITKKYKSLKNYTELLKSKEII